MAETVTRMAARAAAYPRTCALLAGGLAACGFEPLRLWPLTLGGIAVLLALVARAPRARGAALLGWLWGLGHFCVGNAWIATAFTYQAEMPAWLGWIGVFLLALYLAVYPAVASLSAWWLARRAKADDGARSSAAALILAFAGCWIVAEWLRSWVFTGFAWNPLAAAALGGFARPRLALVLPWLGTYALSGVVVLLGGLWFAAALERGGRRWLIALLPVAAFLLPLNGGSPVAGTLPFTLVQPDVRQEVLNEPTQYEANFLKTAQLTLPQRPGSTRLVLWPESGVPDYLREGYSAHLYRETTYAASPVLARRRIGQVIGLGGLLLTGAVDLEMQGERAAGARNVVTALDQSGAIRGSYAKAHLVPYGEYLPMRGLLEPLGLSRLVAGTLDFQPGPGPRTLALGPWGKAGVQICYEVIFSGHVADRRNRPDYLFNPSNDGWFGAWGPPQHLAQARLRAIEEGLPVLRATTTGISAVIDANGVVRQHVPRHVAGRLDGVVPPAHRPTLFARWGNALALAWAGVFLALSLVAMRARRG